MARLDERPEVSQKQCAKQGGDVQTVGIRIGEHANLVIAEAVEAIGPGVDAERHADVVHFLRAQELCGVDLPSVQYLAAQRHHGLRFPVTGLLRRAPGRIALDEEQLR